MSAAYALLAFRSGQAELSRVMSMIFVRHHFVPRSPTWLFPHRRGRFQKCYYTLAMEGQRLNRQSSMDHFLAVAKGAIYSQCKSSLTEAQYGHIISNGVCAVGLSYVEKQYPVPRLPPDNMPSASLD